MNDPVVWYAIPSANRERAQGCLQKWWDRGYKTAVAFDHGTVRIDTADYQTWVHYNGYFPVTNELIKYLYLEEEADLVVVGGDDMHPDPNKTAQEIAVEFFERFPDTFGVMQPIGDRGIDGTDRICGSPWIGRDFALRMNQGKGPFWNEYYAYYGDEELKVVAEELGVLWQRPDLTQFHHHWCRPGGPPKQGYQHRNERFWNRDQTIFRRRQVSKFPGSEALTRRRSSHA